MRVQMNCTRLKGYLKNIVPSHNIRDIEFSKGDMLVRRPDGKEDTISVRFKKFSLPKTFTEGDEIEFVGNLRSYSQKIDENHSKVSVYVFTYFDVPAPLDVEVNNIVCLDGRICKKADLRRTKDGKSNIHFTIANNIEAGDQKLNSYIPCAAWGKLAKEVDKLNVGDKVYVCGELHSREFKKYTSDDEYEIGIAHECVIDKIEVIE